MKWTKNKSGSIYEADCGIHVVLRRYEDGWNLTCKELGIDLAPINAASFNDAVLEAQRTIKEKADSLYIGVSSFIRDPYFKNEFIVKQ